MNDVSLASRPIEAPARISPAGLARLLDQVPGVKALSLDCFDTVVWRHVDRPTDVFHDAVRRPAFVAHGFTAKSRVAAEQTARSIRQVQSGRTEVGLAEIYRAARPQLTDRDVHELAEDELASEMEFCYAHPAAIALLRRARAKRVPVTIVSDTYLDEQRLRRLLTHVLPADAMAAIARIVCSSVHGLSKTQGLFGLAYRNATGVPGSILHIGDNRAADYEAPHRFGIKAVHLVQHHDDDLERSRMQAAALSILDPGIRGIRALHAPYRGPLAVGRRDDEADRPDIGYVSLGPIMHAFGRWIAQERRALAQSRSRVKLLYLLRDGHLPALAHEAIETVPDCHRVRISRFAAFAASFRGLDDIDRYLAQFASSRRFDAIVRQFLLPAEAASTIVAEAQAANDPVAAFCEAVRRPDVVARIVEASSRYRSRMRRYLERETGMQQGDTLVFVDLGYVGTAQRVLGPVFAQEWGVEVVGRYLLSVGFADDARRGLFDRSWCDDRAIDSLVPYVALMENLCSGAGGSVEDYTDDGQAVLGERLIDPTQQESVDAIQVRCIEFVRNAEAFFSQCVRPVGVEWLRDTALAEFARLVFLPSAAEIGCFEEFQLDLNLGTSDRLRLFDCEAGADGLRQRGMNFMERNSKMRLLYPVELRAAGLELSMTVLAQHRFGLDLPISGWAYRHEDIEVLVARGNRSTRETVRAQPTRDGYFAATVPLGDGSFHVGLLFGVSHRWLQVHSVELVPLENLMRDSESLHRRDIRSALIMDGVRDHGEGLWECEHAAAFAMIPAGLHQGGGAGACRVVFRPIMRNRPVASP